MNTQIFIAAGGKGTRLGNLTAETPKSMVEVYGRPIIDHIVDSARQAGVDTIVVGLDEEKPLLRRHLARLLVSIQEDCAEPLTRAFFQSAAINRPDVMIGVNGDTIYHPESIRRVLDLLEADPTAAAAVLLTNVVKPINASSWTYWLHRMENGEVVAMDEVPGHMIRTEYVMAAFRTTALEELSEGFECDYSDRNVPFTCYSYGWDYLLRLLLWKEQKVLGMVNDELTLNINHPSDIEAAVSFFEDPSRFRWDRMTLDGSTEPLATERSLVLLDSLMIEAIQSQESEWMDVIHASLREFGLIEISMQFVKQVSCFALLVEGRGAYHRAQRWVHYLRKIYKQQGANATFSRSSFNLELARQLSALDWEV